MLPEQGMYTITYGSRRDIGLVRQENQDQIISFDSSVYGQVFLLADGMGGHAGGAVAANMAITGFKRHFQTLATKLPLRESLMEAARLTNLDIYEKSNEKESGAGALRMGSTLVACVVSGGSYVVVHAGDSRCYVFRKGVLTRLTKDRTPAFSRAHLDNAPLLRLRYRSRNLLQWTSPCCYVRTDSMDTWRSPRSPGLCRKTKTRRPRRMLCCSLRSRPEATTISRFL